MRQSAITWLMTGSLLLAAAAGCGGGMSATDVASAQSSLDRAKELETNGDYVAALESAEAAVSEAGLDPDQYVEALLLRARCLAETGAVEKALADLEMAEQGSPDEGLLHFTQGVIFSKQGKTKEAKKEFSIARRLNPTLVAR
jgi:tetratricopeptide (TPR) repeat protein